MASKDFSQKLKDLRLKAGYTQKQVYEHFNVPQSTFSSWEVGKSEPSGEMLIKLCKFYNCDMLKEFSSTGNDNVTYAELRLIEKYRKLDVFGQETVDYVLDREYKIAEQINNYKKQLESRPNNIIEFSSPADDANRLVKYYHGVSAGSGVFIMGNEVVDQIAIPDTPDNRNVDYAISVTGNSMEPDFYDGDIALVSQKAEIRYGDVGIFVVNGSAYIKEYDEFELISRNPDVANIEISEYDNIVCMGKVIGKISSSASVLSPEDEEALRLARNLLEQKKKNLVRRRRK